jgi:hypothetical protein
MIDHEKNTFTEPAVLTFWLSLADNYSVSELEEIRSRVP